jgi:hypothetical protein
MENIWCIWNSKQWICKILQLLRKCGNWRSHSYAQRNSDFQTIYSQEALMLWYQNHTNYVTCLDTPVTWKYTWGMRVSAWLSSWQYSMPHWQNQNWQGSKLTWPQIYCHELNILITWQRKKLNVVKLSC